MEDEQLLSTITPLFQTVLLFFPKLFTTGAHLVKFSQLNLFQSTEYQIRVN